MVAAGVLLVERASGPLDPIGLTLALLVLAGEVGFSLLAVRPLRRIGAVGVSFHAVWVAAAQLAIGALLLERHALRWPTAVEAGALAHLAMLVTVVAFIAWYTALDRLGADRAGLLLGTVAVTALATAALVGTATVTPATVLGCALVIAGVTPRRAHPPRQATGNTRTTASPPSTPAHPRPHPLPKPLTDPEPSTKDPITRQERNPPRAADTAGSRHGIRCGPSEHPRAATASPASRTAPDRCGWRIRGRFDPRRSGGRAQAGKISASGPTAVAG